MGKTNEASEEMAEMKVIIKSSIILNALLLTVVMVLGILLCNKTHKNGIEQRVDTLTLAEYPVSRDTQAGRALPTIDTVWHIEKIILPLWSLQYVEYQYSAVKTVVVKQGDDSAIVHATTYYAPDGFRLYFEKDSLRFDTFPRVTIAALSTEKPKLWHWEIATGATYRDTTFRPMVRFGGELGGWHLGKAELSWRMIETEWEFRLPLALSSYLLIRF